MNDIFISYAREDADSAARLAKAFQREGWKVWWDRSLLAGDSFEQVIREELDNSRCVIVLWSTHSIGSDWVRGEARIGNSRQVLVPVLIDEKVQDIDIPIEFQGFHTERLLKWKGDIKHEVYRRLTEAVKRTGARPTGSQTRVGEQTKRGLGLRSIAVAVAMLGVAGFALSWTGALDGLFERVGGTGPTGPPPITWDVLMAETVVVGRETTIAVVASQDGDDRRALADTDVAIRLTGANPDTLPTRLVEGRYVATYEPENPGEDTVVVLHAGNVTSAKPFIAVVHAPSDQQTRGRPPQAARFGFFSLNVRRPATVSVDGRVIKEVQGRDSIRVQAGRDVRIRLEWKIDIDRDDQWDCQPWDSVINVMPGQVVRGRAFLQCSE